MLDLEWKRRKEGEELPEGDYLYGGSGSSPVTKRRILFSREGIDPGDWYAGPIRPSLPCPPLIPIGGKQAEIQDGPRGWSIFMTWPCSDSQGNARNPSISISHPDKRMIALIYNAAAEEANKHLEAPPA